MNKEKVLQIIALFMINLIIFIPIAHAQTTEEETTEATILGITVKSIVITDTSGKTIEYFAPQETLLDLTIEIGMINLKTVSANFLFDGTLSANCIPFPQYTRCTWNDIPYSLKSESINEEAIITVIDKDSNEISQAIDLIKEITKDESGPSVSNLKITDRLNKDLTGWISGNPLEAYVYVDVKDEGSGFSSIKADLNELNIDADYSAVDPTTCTDIENGKKCRFDIIVKLTEPKSSSLIFTAKDKSGNSEAATLSYSFKVDSVGPEAVDIKTDKIHNSYSYVKEIENTFIATIKEEGIGIENRDILLDLSELGASVLPATKCESLTCYWENIAITATDGSYKVKLSPQSSDKLGNRLINTLEKEVKVDIKAPIVENIEVTPVAGTMPLIEGFIQTGNALSIKATLYEPTGLIAIADLSRFIKDADAIEGSCVQNENYVECIWETAEIDKEGFIVNYIRFKFADAVGNIEEFEYPLIVFAAGIEEPDYWQASVGYPSPDGIDKELIALYDPYIYFPVDLRTKTNQKVWPLSVEISDCVNKEGESYSSYLSSALNNLPELFDYNKEQTGADIYNIYLKYTLERALPSSDELPITCNLKIRSLVDQQMISQLETEEVKVIIPYYYNPLGTLDANIEKEIDRVSNTWLVQGKWIQSFNTVFSWAKTVCRIGEDFVTIINVLAKVVDLLKGGCSIGIAPLCQQNMENGIELQFQKSAFRRIYNTHIFEPCKLLSCQLWEKDWGIKSSKTKDGAEKLEQTAGFLSLGDLSRQDWFLQSRAYSKQGWFGNVDPQHSLIYSVAFLCLPGVFYNLQKARVIDCQYVSCLKQTSLGMPVQMCTSQRSYGYCKFVYGEVFNLFPFASALSYLSTNVRKALSNPADSIGFVIGAACRTQCTTAVGSCAICTALETFNVGLEMLCDLGVGKNCEPVWSQFKVNDNVCSAITDQEEETEEGEAVA